ncbi:phosphotransferase [Aquihabitans daechungensis]|uniref:phosphotransferase n=1 Tax=Aquihabitans daechungensis TaxID=1052257 RepID=UPI003BA01E7B
MSAPTAEWFAQQRWFAGKGTGAEPGETLRTPVGGTFDVDLVEVSGDQYQLVSQGSANDSMDDPATARALIGALQEGSTAGGPAGEVAFHLDPTADLANRSIRPVGVEQSNTSVIVDDRWILKVFRRIQPGINPELEVLRFLADRGAANVPRLAGWYEVSSGPVDGTLGVLQGLVPDAVDGWTWVLEQLPRHPEATMAPLHRLGAIIATLHATLATGSDAFGTAPGGPDLSRAIADGIAADAKRVAASLPPAHRHVRDALTEAIRTAEELADGLDAGRAQRVHGDLHLGQVLLAGGDWTVIDWEGEPSRPIGERRALQPALRDVAGVLRSLSYAATTAARRADGPPLDGWLAAARAALLDGYLSAADPRLLPSPSGATQRLLRLLELEKIVYEVGYESANRPGWLDIPVGALDEVTRSRAA